jgi:hypothetical protein
MALKQIFNRLSLAIFPQLAQFLKILRPASGAAKRVRAYFGEG